MTGADQNVPATRRQWSKTAETKARILRAAESVFAERGYSNATIAEVIERSRSSVGSIYHHFGGKTELYLAIWEELSRELAHAASSAVAEARTAGTSDPIELFEAGGRAYLRAIWQHRGVAEIFWHGDTPPGFDALRRGRGETWTGINLKLLGLRSSARDRYVAAVFTALIGEAARSIVGCTRAAQAEQISDEALRLAHLIHHQSAVD